MGCELPLLLVALTCHAVAVPPSLSGYGRDAFTVIPPWTK